MATALKLYDGTATVNLITGALKLEDGSWEVTTSDNAIWETMNLVGMDTDANIRTAYDNLEDIRDKAIKYAENPIEATPVWFTWQSTGETAKQALVLDMEIKIVASEFNSPLLGRGWIKLQVAIKRQAFFEAVSATAYSPGALSGTGGKAALAALGGAVDGRIASITATTETAAAALHRVWIGLRPKRGATVTGFIPLWECEDGSINNSPTDCVVVTGADASGGECVKVNFNTATLNWRVNIYLSQVAASEYDDFVGRYLVLARLKVDAADTQVAVQLEHGWMGYSQGSVVGTTYISGGTNYHLVELGQVQLPPTGYRGTGPTIGNGLEDYALRINAERLSAGGYLYLDCLILIPSEHLLITDGTALASAAGAVGAYVNPLDNEQYAIGAQTNDILGNIEYSFTNWVMPKDGAILVVAAQAASTHSLTPTITPVFSCFPRFRGLRT